MDPPTIAAIGAFLTGVGAVLPALLALRNQRNRAADECEKRIHEIQKAFRDGLKMGRDERSGRWSNLA